MAAVLEKEYKYYLNHLDELIKQHPNKFVVIKHSRIIGFYDSYAQALKRGLKDFGNVPFFIKEVRRHEEVHFLRRNPTE